MSFLIFFPLLGQIYEARLACPLWGWSDEVPPMQGTQGAERSKMEDLRRSIKGLPRTRQKHILAPSRAPDPVGPFDWAVSSIASAMRHNSARPSVRLLIICCPILTLQQWGVIMIDGLVLKRSQRTKNDRGSSLKSLAKPATNGSS
ncbi:hypothetical protein F4776DRAFT_647697 [Hypoxylon sp. NC0597]|nr:hypothetical protein F4776DRAFT_647697 [Hypoxylon sp. NC0597]